QIRRLDDEIAQIVIILDGISKARDAGTVTDDKVYVILQSKLRDLTTKRKAFIELAAKLNDSV
ncbi:MAG TPA: hypothetical protein VEB86_18335, partial [Chryseosolibacter sp.]|nr:hypothetical protein [Chryseosolibacter sp.]